MSLLCLPNELLLEIAEHLETQRDLLSLIRTSHWFAGLLTPLLHRLAVQDRTASDIVSAASKGHIGLIRLLLAEGFDINYQRHGRSKTALSQAVIAKNEETVRFLLKNGADANLRCNLGFTPLYIASRQGSRNIIQELLDNGAVISATDRSWQTALHVAVSLEREAAVSLLLERGADPDREDIYGETPLRISLARTSDVSKRIAWILSKYSVSVGVSISRQATLSSGKNMGWIRGLSCFGR